MGVDGSAGGARRGGSVGQEPLDSEVVVGLEARGYVEGRDVFSGKGNFDLWAGSGCEGRLGSH